MLDWSPVSERWLGIIEPLVAKLLNVIVIDVSNSLGNLTSWESSSKVEHVSSDLRVDRGWGLGSEEGVVEEVSASDDLDVVEVMRVDGWKADSAIVHLSGEDLVSKEVVSEETTVRVSHVVAVGSGNIRKISKKRVHGVVLLVAVIQMLGMLIDSVGTEHVLKEEERVVVLVLDTWSIVEDTNVGVYHLVISDEEECWDIYSLLSVLDLNASLLWKRSESLVNSVDDLIV